MRIAQVAPLYESVPPRLYGGTERVVSYLTEALVRGGHDVTLFASGDSITQAELISPCRQALRLSGIQDPYVYHAIALDQVFSMADQFDLIHFHTDYLHFPASRNREIANLTTLHGRLDLPDLAPLFDFFHQMPLVSISKAQRAPISAANWVGNVYHGLPLSLHPPTLQTGKYLAFLGRISPEKRPDRAIEIALKAGMPLKIAAKVDRADSQYFEHKIRPMLDNPGIEFIGEISESEKSDFLGNAFAYLFPIDWPEPFGLTMIEAMACGTPTVAFRCGSVPEVLKNGVSGFIVDSRQEAVDALKQVGSLDRCAVRAEFECRFSDVRMAKDYIRVYERILAAPDATPERRVGPRSTAII
ncbi:MAG TPA: glycosyltransferase family 4 protein [Candidatus Sulfotelmatobacter sp.]